MKNKVKRLSVWLVCVLAAAVVFACGKKDDAPAYAFDDYTYVNPSAEKVVTDAEITLDGKPDEGLWSEKRWFKTALPNQPDITASFTSHFGEKGAYFAFRAQDPAVYATVERSIFNNAGFQLYVTTSTGSARDAATYEVVVDAAGRTAIRKYIRMAPGSYNYASWPQTFYAEVVTEGGPVNSGSCTGYTMEVFLPWRIFEVAEQPTFLKTNVAFVRSLSANVNEGRLYYNIGQNERGADWADTQGWYTFDTNGLVASDVHKTVSAGGAIESADYVLDGDDYPITVKPEAGHYLKSLIVNDTECLQALRYDYTAQTASYTVNGATGEMDITAEFAALPAARAVTGTVTAETPLPNNNFALAQLYAVKNGSITPIQVAADGTFTAQLPATEMQLIATAPDYLINSVTIPADATQTTVSLETNPFGNNAAVQYTGYTPNAWDMSRYLTDGTITAMPITIVKPFEKMYVSDMSADSIFLSGRIRMSRGTTDYRNGFTFRDAQGNNVFFALLWDNKAQSYGIQAIGDSPSSSDYLWKGLGANFRQTLPETDGLPFAIQYKNGKFNVWLDGVKTHSDYTAYAADGVPLAGNLAAGLECWVKGGDFYDVEYKTGAEADAGLPTTGLKPIAAVVGMGSVAFDKTTFSVGDSVVVTVTPAEGFFLGNLTVNSVDRTDDVEDNALTVTAGQSLVVRATFMRLSPTELTYSGTVSLTKDNATTLGAGATVTLANDEYSETTTADSEGRFTFSAPAGRYTLTAGLAGYFTFTTSVTINRDDQIEITLDGNFAELTTLTPSGVDLSHMNDADHAISFTARNAAARIKLTAEQQNAKQLAVITTIRVNAVSGNWDDNFGILMAGADNGGTSRYGLTFLYETLDNVNKNTYIKQQWGNFNVVNSIPTWISELLWKDNAPGAGLEIMMIRDHASLELYAKKDGAWVYLCSTAIPENEPNDVRLYSCGKSTFYNTSVGEIPAITVSKNTVEHGSVTVDPVAYGEDLVIHVTVDTDYRLENLTVNGKPYTEYTGATSAAGVITIPGWKAFTADIVATVGEIPQEYTYSGTVSLHKDGATAPGNGVTVTLKDSGTYNETHELGTDGTFSFRAYAGTYTLTAVLDGYVKAEQEVTIVGNVTAVSITLEWKFATVTYTNGGTVDLSHMNDANHSIAMRRGTGGVNVELTLTEAQKTSKQLAVYATIKADQIADKWNDNFGITLVGTTDATRSGLCFLYGNLADITKDTYIKQQWAGTNAMSVLPQWIGEAIKGDGLDVLYIRNGMQLHLYAKQNGAYVYLCSTAVRADGDNVVYLWQCGYSTYSNLSVTTTLPAITVTKNTVEHGSVTVDPVAYGEDLVIRVTVNDNCRLDSLTVNGKSYTEYTGATSADGVITIPGWILLQADVNVNIIEVLERTYGGTVSLHKDGATKPGAGATITLKDADAYNETLEAGTDGTFSFNASTGTYTLTAALDGYVTAEKTVTISDSVTDASITLEWKFAEKVSGSVDLSKMNDADHAIGLTTGNSGARLTLTAEQKAAKQIVVYTTIKANEVKGNWDDNFAILMAGESGTERSGFTFLFQTLDNLGSNTYIKQHWTNVNLKSGLPTWIGEAIKGDGLPAMVVRNGAQLSLYAKNGEDWVYLASTAVAESLENDIRFWQWGNSTYSNTSVSLVIPENLPTA